MALHAAKITGLLNLEVVPLLTRNLTPLATDTFRNVDQLRVRRSARAKRIYRN